MHGLLIVGHGTRDPRGLAEFHETVALVARQAPGVVVQGCFLELAEPRISEGVERLARQGVRQITAVPLLLFAAGHVKRDIPQALAKAQAATGVDVRFARPLGCQRSVLRLSARRFQQTMTAASARPEETLLLIVGRGSYDPGANAEMARFARLRFEQTPVGWYELAFTAMAEPLLERSVYRIGAMGYRHVVVQPHLLFHGQLFQRIEAEVAESARQFPSQTWRVTPYLGADPRLAHAVLARAGGRLRAVVGPPNAGDTARNSGIAPATGCG